LKSRLKQIAKARNLKDGQPLTVDLLMVSHIDDDHIQGILDLTKELTGPNRPWLQALSFWHNSFDDLIGHKPDELTANFKSQFGAAAMAGDSDELTLCERDDDLDEETVVSSLKVLASIQQGAQLRRDAEKLGFPLNPEFDGGLIIASEDSAPKEIGQGVTFTVISPTKDDLERLYEKHQKWLLELKEAGKKPADVLAAYVDESVTNLSSIVVLAEAEGKRMLLTGDARGDKILEGLKRACLFEKDGKIRVDVLKAPHHGSSNNISRDFFEKIIANHYVFSGNGEHGNPERETMEMLLEARKGEDYTVHLTYPVAEIDVARKAEWEKQRGKEQKRKLKKPKTEVRAEWVDDKNSLTAFFAEHKNFADKLSIVEENKVHLIDLLDRCAF